MSLHLRITIGHHRSIVSIRVEFIGSDGDVLSGTFLSTDVGGDIRKCLCREEVAFKVVGRLKDAFAEEACLLVHTGCCTRLLHEGGKVALCA